MEIYVLITAIAFIADGVGALYDVHFGKHPITGIKPFTYTVAEFAVGGVGLWLFSK